MLQQQELYQSMTDGEMIGPWVDIKPIWVDIRPLSAYERIQAQQAMMIATHRIWMRAVRDLKDFGATLSNPSRCFRFVYGTKVYKIQAPIDQGDFWEFVTVEEQLQT